MIETDGYLVDLIWRATRMALARLCVGPDVEQRIRAKNGHAVVAR